MSPDAPAPRLPLLFPGLPVITEEVWSSRPLPPLIPEEAIFVAGAAAQRKAEYAAGRYCARRALGRLGIEGFALATGPDRAPVWPVGVVGSITHTTAEPDAYCGVAVGRSEDVAGLGLDAERRLPLREDLWDTVLTRREREGLWRQAEPGRGELASVHFCAKETVYKALYPLERRFLDFHAVELGLDPERGEFVARVDGYSASWPVVRGRMLIEGNLILTGLMLPG